MFREALCLALLLTACGGEAPSFTVRDAAPPPADLASSDAPDGGASFERDVAPLDRPRADVPSSDEVLVYAHTAGELFRVDPRGLTIERVGPFNFPDDGQDHRMTDLAVNAARELWGITFDAIYRVDEATARCTLASPLQGLYNGLTFVPAGVLSPTTEVLLAVSTPGEYFVVNTSDGRVQRLGSYGSGLTSSGDLVSIATADTWAIVKRDTRDHLARVDLRAGRTTVVGPTGVDDIWGLGYWRNRLYGFTNTGAFVTIDPDTGRATVQSSTGHAWWGAGVTTLAPTAPP